MPTPLTTIQQDFQVRFRYTVQFTRDLFAPHNPLLKNSIAPDPDTAPRKLLVALDRGVQRHHPQILPKIEAYCRRHPESLALMGVPLLFEGGEHLKNDALFVTILQQAMDAAGLCRHSYVVAIGGGALIDLVGFAAATAHRGIRLIRVPTTVMAQADASIGVKNGINAFGKKNFIGTFAPPVAVLNDADFLPTLSQRDWIGGVAEAVKVALIKDADFFAFLEEHAEALAERDLALMEQVIHRCAVLHLDHIAHSGDPFEFGSSRPLDFGHWAAHKLEHLSGYELGHGQAVALGIALDSTYAYLAGLLPQTQWQRILTTLRTLGFALYDPRLDARHGLLDGLSEFREHLGGRLTIMLLQDIGQGIEVHNIDLDLMRQSLTVLEDAAAASPGYGARIAVHGAHRPGLRPLVSTKLRQVRLQSSEKVDPTTDFQESCRAEKRRASRF
jgi:3-dehydroquinate synthase